VHEEVAEAEVVDSLLTVLEEVAAVGFHSLAVRAVLAVRTALWKTQIPGKHHKHRL